MCLTLLLVVATLRLFEQETWKHERQPTYEEKSVLFKKGGKGGGGFISWFAAKVISFLTWFLAQDTF